MDSWVSVPGEELAGVEPPWRTQGVQEHWGSGAAREKMRSDPGSQRQAVVSP